MSTADPPALLDPRTEFQVLDGRPGVPSAFECCDCGATAELGGAGPLRFEHAENCRQPAQVRRTIGDR